MSRFIKLTKSQVVAHVKKYGRTEVYMIASKMYFNPSHAYSLTLVQHTDGRIVAEKQTDHTLDMAINSFSFYNCTYETGYNVHYYILK